MTPFPISQTLRNLHFPVFWIPAFLAGMTILLALPAHATTTDQSAMADLTSGLVAYYPFNGNANDESGNGNNGIVYGATLTMDRFGKTNSAYYFDGENNYINIPYNPIYFNTQNNISVSIWIKNNSLCSDIDNAPTIIGHSPIPGEYNFYLQICEKIIFGVYTTEDNWLSSNIIQNKWYNITFVAEKGGEYKLYYDGVKVDQNVAGSNFWDTGSITIGDLRPNRNLFFKGVIDDIRIYNRLLSTSEIQQLYEEGKNLPLTVTKAGSGTGTVTSNPDGINCATCAANFTSGTSVTLTATPASGSSFMGWSGDCSGTANTCTVSMNAAKNVTATFNIKTYILTVNTTDNGTVSSSPAGINHCSGLCTASFTGGAAVTLTATAASGSTFSGWSGGGCSGTGNCTVTLNANQSVTASFTANVIKADQTIGAITFNPSTVNVNGTTKASAKATSGLAVIFTTTTPTICTVSGNSVTGKAVGTCKIAANQPGNEKYNAAPPVIKNLTVSASQPNRPDIVVTDIILNPTTPTANGVFNVTVTVKNQGTGSGDAGQLALWIDQPDYQNCGMDADSKAVIGTLAAGASKTLTLNDLLVGNTTGKRTLRVFVDAKCNLVETNEINNQRPKSYTVISGLRSDLVVKSITITPQTPEANSDFNVKVMIKNQGAIPANSGQVSIWVDAPKPKTCDSVNEDQAADLGMLGEGVSTIMNFTLPAGAAGDKVLRVFLDSKCEVAESNENNNQLTKTYTVY